jgi:hypothetical protein
MTWDLHDFRLVTVSAYPGMMAPLTGHPSTVCVVSGDADHDGAVPAGVPAQSLEALGGVRRRWRYGDVAGLADFVPKVASGAWPDPRPILLVSPRINAAWEAAAADWPADLRLIGRSAFDVTRVAEDKVYVREQLGRIGVPVPDSVVSAGWEIRFGQTADTVGAPFVMQAPNSAGGQGTYLVATEAELDVVLAARADVPRWLVSSYAGEVTINVPGIIYADGYQILPASVQASDIGELGVGFGSYCGSDFAAVGRLPQTVLADAYRHTARVATWLHGIGHRGLFGADIAVAGDSIAFLEVNPRIQGSSWLLDKLLRRDGGDGCLERHVEALLGRPVPEPAGTPDRALRGSHVILRWSGPAGVVRSLPPSGTFRIQTDPDSSSSDSSSPDSSSTGIPSTGIVTGLPAIGTVLLPGAIVARIESDAGLTVPAGTALTPAAARFVADLKASLTVSDAG